MKQLNKIESILYVLGGCLMVVGVGLFVFGIANVGLLRIACWLFLSGTILFALMQLMQSYEGTSFTIKRLKHIQTLGDFFFVFAGISMVDTVYQFFRPFFNNYETYLNLLYNKWVVLLLIATVLELYTVHRIDRELKNEANRNGGNDAANDSKGQ